MAELRFVLAGENAAATKAGNEIGSALVADTSVSIKQQPVENLCSEDRKVVDPISLATLVVSVPAAVLAVWDIVDRIAKRRKAQAVVDAAKRLQAEQRVQTYVLAPDGTPRSLAMLDADALLDIVAEIEPRPGQKTTS